jgi:predicted hydrocarbon binding protein
MGSLNKTISANVRTAIKKAGSPTFYRLGHEMAKIMERPAGIGREKYGLSVNPETCRKAVELCLSGQSGRIWRVDYLEALAFLLDVSVVELVSPPKLR